MGHCPCGPCGPCRTKCGAGGRMRACMEHGEQLRCLRLRPTLCFPLVAHTLSPGLTVTGRTSVLLRNSRSQLNPSKPPLPPLPHHASSWGMLHHGACFTAPPACARQVLWGVPHPLQQPWTTQRRRSPKNKPPCSPFPRPAPPRIALPGATGRVSAFLGCSSLRRLQTTCPFRTSCARGAHLAGGYCPGPAEA